MHLRANLPVMVLKSIALDTPVVGRGSVSPERISPSHALLNNCLYFHGFSIIPPRLLDTSAHNEDSIFLIKRVMVWVQDGPQVEARFSEGSANGAWSIAGTLTNLIYRFVHVRPWPFLLSVPLLSLHYDALSHCTWAQKPWCHVTTNQNCWALSPHKSFLF